MAQQGKEFDDELRHRPLRDVSGFFTTVGFAMYARCQKDGDRHGLAIATCIQLLGELSKGICSLVEDHNYYSAVALGRQILEVTQLIEYFISHPDRAEFWLTASDEQLRKAADFRPKGLRTVTGSADWIYSKHCFLGGHPRSVARMLLPGSPWLRANGLVDLSSAGFDIRVSVGGLILADTLQHLYAAVIASIEGLHADTFKELGLLEDRSLKLTDELIERLVNWRKTDPLAMVGG